MPSDTGTEPLQERIQRLRGEVSAHRHGQVPGTLRRSLVVAVATERFIELGYAGVSMASIAADAGVSKPVVYDLVGSKEELFAEVMATAAEDLARRVTVAVRAADASQGILEAGALAFFVFVAERRGAWASLLTSDAAPVRTAMADLRRRQSELVAGLLAEQAASARGMARPLQGVEHVQVEAVAYALNGAFEALAEWWQLHPQIEPADLAALVAMLVEPGLQAMAGESPVAGVAHFQR